jgi:hypothetical protein
VAAAKALRECDASERLEAAAAAKATDVADLEQASVSHMRWFAVGSLKAIR